MEFISIQDVLKGIAVCVKPQEIPQETPRQSDDFSLLACKFWDEERPRLIEEHRFSEAALLFHSALIKHLGIRLPLFKKDGVSGLHAMGDDPLKDADFLDLLSVGMKAWGTAIQKRNHYIEDCKEEGHSPTLENYLYDFDTEWSLESLAKPRRHIAYREKEFGFDCDDVVAFLDMAQVPHALKTVEMTWGGIAKILGRSVKTAQTMNEKTGNIYVIPPGKGGRKSGCLTSETRIKKMAEVYKTLK